MATQSQHVTTSKDSKDAPCHHAPLPVQTRKKTLTSLPQRDDEGTWHDNPNRSQPVPTTWRLGQCQRLGTRMPPTIVRCLFLIASCSMTSMECPVYLANHDVPRKLWKSRDCWVKCSFMFFFPLWFVRCWHSQKFSWNHSYVYLSCSSILVA